MLDKLLKDINIVLASKSPRRIALLEMLNIKFLHIESTADETINEQDHKNPRRYACRVASDKCNNISKDMFPNCLIIAADTIVYHNKQILGKPNSEDTAFAYLSSLSGDTHTVYTAICISYKAKRYSAVERTNVVFKKLSEQEIRDYIATGEPMDKAGAYGIQGYGSQFIEKINGCYFNVMGFPINKFYQLIEQILKG